MHFSKISKAMKMRNHSIFTIHFALCALAFAGCAVHNNSDIAESQSDLTDASVADTGDGAATTIVSADILGPTGGPAATGTMTSVELVACADGGAADVRAYRLHQRPSAASSSTTYNYYVSLARVNETTEFVDGYVSTSGMPAPDSDYYSSELPFSQAIAGASFTQVDDPANYPIDSYWSPDSSGLSSTAFSFFSGKTGASVRGLNGDGVPIWSYGNAWYSPNAHTQPSLVDTTSADTTENFASEQGGLLNAVMLDNANVLHIFQPSSTSSAKLSDYTFSFAPARADDLLGIEYNNGGDTPTTAVRFTWQLVAENEFNIPIPSFRLPSGVNLGTPDVNPGLLLGDFVGGIQLGIAPDGTPRIAFSILPYPTLVASDYGADQRLIYGEFVHGAWVTELVDSVTVGAMVANLSGTIPIVATYASSDFGANQPAVIVSRTAPGTWTSTTPTTEFVHSCDANVAPNAGPRCELAQTRWFKEGALPYVASSLAPSIVPDVDSESFLPNDDGSFHAVVAYDYVIPPADPTTDYPQYVDAQLIYYVCPSGGDCFCH